MLEVLDLRDRASEIGGYTPGVEKAGEEPNWLRNLRLLVGDEHGAQTRVATAAKMPLSQLQTIIAGGNRKPQINTLERIVVACGGVLEDLFSRPEEDAGDDDGRRRDERASVQLEHRRLLQLDAEAPAEDTARGDILRAQAALDAAQAALNRALRRPDAKSGAA